MLDCRVAKEVYALSFPNEDKSILGLGHEGQDGGKGTALDHACPPRDDLTLEGRG